MMAHFSEVENVENKLFAEKSNEHSELLHLSGRQPELAQTRVSKVNVCCFSSLYSHVTSLSKAKENSINNGYKIKTNTSNCIQIQANI